MALATRRATGAAPVTWHVHKEVVLLAGWGRAILMQVAHPLIAQGVADHSGFRGGRFRRLVRLHRTLGAMLRLTFGTPEEASAVIRRINGIHDRVNGRMLHATGAFQRGTPYSARDVELLRWVHATCVQSFLLAYETFVVPLTPEERDAYCAQSAGIEEPLGMPRGFLPRTMAGIEDYVARMLASGAIDVGETARELAHAVLYPPLTWLGAPVVHALRLSTVGLLPPPLRQAYGLPWGPRRQTALSVLARLTRRVLPALPPRLRCWATARRAFRREGYALDRRGPFARP